ncbi:4'-phosphopantetheinyl transferase [Pseudoduganella flava]|uniref:4'-phosphopantetheinyl transferase n=1 Tax=Pseudoduganella flava TaxID=871742 RepID=A0A562PHT4_9BURK|nr:4'-phosphopantetheinyl transferase superfamily protein [Pseudoduganella flava]QGZ37648.1 4'-phosphopantetheinyl transferase superfamily protein [Pseudoduganella flava]TWI43989.1 4'-phosphopantetheinyl transferase [Pseudoduganella flava]
MTSNLCTRRSHSFDAPATPGIDIWLAHYRQFTDQPRLRAVLSPAERDKEQRFHFADDRMRYLVTRALVRGTLSRYAPVAPDQWRFEDTPFGQPRIANAEPECAGLAFNISHTGGLIALAVTRERALGIDVENVTARHSSEGIARRFFSAAEVAALEAVPPALRHERFFEYWTFKEAYIKARGMGLSLPLERFTIHFPQDDEVRLEIDPELGDDPQRWCLWQLRPAPGYLLALCAERKNTAVPAVTVWTAVPGTEGDLFGV